MLKAKYLLSKINAYYPYILLLVFDASFQDEADNGYPQLLIRCSGLENYSCHHIFEFFSSVIFLLFSPLLTCSVHRIHIILL